MTNISWSTHRCISPNSRPTCTLAVAIDDTSIAIHRYDILISRDEASEFLAPVHLQPLAHPCTIVGHSAIHSDCEVCIDWRSSTCPWYCDAGRGGSQRKCLCKNTGYAYHLKFFFKKLIRPRESQGFIFQVWDQSNCRCTEIRWTNQHSNTHIPIKPHWRGTKNDRHLNTLFQARKAHKIRLPNG